MPLLELENVSLSFGGVRAISDLSLSVSERTVTALIGPNGAGKTSVLNVISRLYLPQSGRIRFGTADLTRLPAHAIINLGVARSFQNVALFPNLSVLDNMKIGSDHRGSAGLLRNMFRLPASQRHERDSRDRAYQTLEFLGITELAHRPAGQLAFGQQKLVDLGRALVSSPSLLLLDEPAAGMPEALRERLGDLVRAIPSRYESAVLLIDHDMPLVLGVAEHVVVMDFGIKIAEGTPEQIRRDSRVLAAYLGEADA